MTVAYIQQNCSVDILSQRGELSSFAVSHSLGEFSWIEGKGKGKDGCKDLVRVLNSCSDGDVVIVHELTRMCSALSNIYEMLELCQKKDIRLYSVREEYIFGDPMTSQLITRAFGMAVEAEKRIHSFRTREGLADLKATEVKLGRKVGTTTKLNYLDTKRQSIVSMSRDGDNVKEISQKLGVSFSTMYKYLRMHPELVAAKS